MYRFVAVFLVAALSIQGSNAETSADSMQNPYIKSLAQYLESLPNAISITWKSFSEYELRNTILGNRFEFWSDQLKYAWSNTCIENLRGTLKNLKTQAIDIFKTCANLLTLTPDQAKINDAMNELKTLDGQVQEVGKQCNNIRNIWQKRGCDMSIRAEKMPILMKARFESVMPVYDSARDQMEEKGEDLISCVSERTATILQQLENDLPKLYDCPSAN